MRDLEIRILDWADWHSEKPITSQIEAGRIYIVHDIGLMLYYSVSKNNDCIFIGEETVIHANKKYVGLSLNTFGGLEFDDEVPKAKYGGGKYLPKKYRSALKRKGLWSIRDQK